MIRFLSTSLVLATALLACADDSNDNESPANNGDSDGSALDTGADAGAPADAADVETPEDVAPTGDTGRDAEPDVEVERDTADSGDATDAVDNDGATDALDAADVTDTPDIVDPTDPTFCACDTSDFCEEGCACDVACSAAAGALPLGTESVGLERNEVVLFHPTDFSETFNRMTLHNDGSGWGFPRFPVVQAAAVSATGVTSAPESTMRPMTLTGDVDNDGRDETVVVSATDVSVVDWNGTSLTMRTVYRHDAREWFDAALGDLDHNGGRLLVISRQAGDAVTVEVLDLSGGSDAFVRATTEVTGVVRHAVAVGSPSAGEPALVHLLTTAAWAGFREPATMHLFALDGDTLTEVDTVEMAPFCSVGSSTYTTDDGITLLVGDLMQFPAGNEWFVTAYCPEPQPSGGLVAGFYDRTGAQQLWSTVGSDGTRSTIHVNSGRVRPVAALGQFSRVPAEPGVQRFLTPLVAWIDGSAVARVASFGSLNTSGTTSVRRAQGQRRIEGNVVNGLAARDVDGDGMDETIVSYAYGWDPCNGRPFACSSMLGSRVMVFDEDSRNDSQIYGDEKPNATWTSPLLAAGDFDRDTVRIRFTGNIYRKVTGWQVNAVVAAPPNWLREGVTHASGSGTSFGQTVSEGVSHGGTLSYGGSVSVGIGVSAYDVLQLYIEFYAAFGVTHSWTAEDSVTLGQAINAGELSDLVSLSRAIYVLYEYEVVSHPDPEMIGRTMTIDEVDSVVQATIGLDRFYETIPNAELLIPPGLLTHTVGEPDTYDQPRTCTREALQSRIGTGAVSAVYESPSLTDVGDAPSGSRTISVEVSEQSEFGTDVTFEVGTTVGGALVVEAGATAWVGGGYAYRNTVGSSASYTGSVGVISEGYDLDTRFQWGLCVFHWADQPGDALYASYPVVTYVVDQY